MLSRQNEIAIIRKSIAESIRSQFRSVAEQLMEITKQSDDAVVAQAESLKKEIEETTVLVMRYKKYTEEGKKP